MYIKRKVFSVAYDENGDEKLFSTTEIMDENAYIERLYAESEKKTRKKVSLDEVDSNVGRGRAILTAIPTGFGSLTGGYLAKDEADKADKEGESDERILRRARNKGLKIGAITGAATGALGTAGNVLRSKNKAAALGQGLQGMAAATAFGALGGRNAAGVNTKDRLRKRRSKEQNLERD